jgi:hypothetical protein
MMYSYLGVIKGVSAGRKKLVRYSWIVRQKVRELYSDDK